MTSWCGLLTQLCLIGRKFISQLQGTSEGQNLKLPKFWRRGVLFTPSTHTTPRTPSSLFGAHPVHLPTLCLLKESRHSTLQRPFSEHLECVCHCDSTGEEVTESTVSEKEQDRGGATVITWPQPLILWMKHLGFRGWLGFSKVHHVD
jgi:hypothetical protein